MVRQLLDFRVICAWCDKFLRGDPNAESLSHGICEDCVEKYFPENKENL